MANTTRMALPYPTGTTPSDVDGWMKLLAEAVDALAAIYGQGTFANRPISTAGSPGKAGRFYVVTSGTENGQVWYDHGTGWIQVNPSQAIGPDSITAAMIAAAAVTASELADNAVDTAALQDSAVTFAKLAAALKPSQGAGASAEALRALGTGAANAAAGNDARLSDQRTPLDGSVTPAKANLGVLWNFASNMLTLAGLRVHRHPYGTDRHIESGQVSVPVGGQAVVFTDAFASAPRVVVSLVDNTDARVSANSITTSGFTLVHDQGSNRTMAWIAEGAD